MATLRNIKSNRFCTGIAIMSKPHHHHRYCPSSSAAVAVTCCSVWSWAVDMPHCKTSGFTDRMKLCSRGHLWGHFSFSGVPPQLLLHFYTAVICPVLEYASPVWHYSITRAQSQHLESIQKRAVHIIFSFTRGMSYPNILFVANLNSLQDRRDKCSRTFFQNMCKPASCLHHLLPPSRNTSVISRLCYSTPLPRPTSRTKKFEAFVNFAHNKYQSPL